MRDDMRQMLVAIMFGVAMFAALIGPPLLILWVVVHFTLKFW